VEDPTSSDDITIGLLDEIALEFDVAEADIMGSVEFEDDCSPSCSIFKPVFGSEAGIARTNVTCIERMKMSKRRRRDGVCDMLINERRWRWP
jgi:hypothetical protein